MSRRTIAAVIAVIVAALGLYLLMRGDGSGSGNGSGNGVGNGNGNGNGNGVGVGNGNGNAGDGGPRTRLRDTGAGMGTAAAAATADGTRTYVTDTGNLVRDHRPDVRDPVALPAPMSPEERTMDSVVTAEIYRQLAPVVRGCGNDLDAETKGPESIVHVTLLVDVAAEQLVANQATAVTSGITGPSVDKVIACVRDRAAGLKVAAKGEPDRTGYVVQYPIRLR